ncbi:MAG: glutamate ligase domain-containing protein [Bacteroidota bacterium]|jgi:UDP-N-acetylmuramoylalanine--D-glutamate ligase
MEKPQSSSRSTMKATSMDRLIKIRRDFIKDRLNNMQVEEHNFEIVQEVKGVTYINHSASTDVDSTWLALEKVDKNIIWIVGGVDRGNDYSMLKDLVKDKVLHIVCLGNYITKIFKAFSQFEEKLIVNASSADEAVHHAATLAKAGDTVLFSPTCASYDLFENVEARGNEFKRAVNDLLNNTLHLRYPSSN